LFQCSSPSTFLYDGDRKLPVPHAHRLVRCTLSTNDGVRLIRTHPLHWHPWSFKATLAYLLCLNLAFRSHTFGPPRERRVPASGDVFRFVVTCAIFFRQFLFQFHVLSCLFSPFFLIRFPTGGPCNPDLRFSRGSGAWEVRSRPKVLQGLVHLATFSPTVRFLSQRLGFGGIARTSCRNSTIRVSLPDAVTLPLAPPVSWRRT